MYNVYIHMHIFTWFYEHGERYEQIYAIWLSYLDLRVGKNEGGSNRKNKEKLLLPCSIFIL